MVDEEILSADNLAVIHHRIRNLPVLAHGLYLTIFYEPPMASSRCPLTLSAAVELADRVFGANLLGHLAQMRSQNVLHFKTM